MGRLRFTLTNIMFWVVLLLSCLLAENYALFADKPRSGFDSFPLYFLTFAVIGLMVFYYIVEHKKNGLTFDKILLPALIMIGAIMIWNIFRQGDRSFINWAKNGTFEISFTFGDRMLAALQVVIWLGLLYAIVFVYNRYRLNIESYRWVLKIYIVIIFLFCLIDLFYEWDVIASILNGKYKVRGVEFIFGHPNVWGLVLFSGIVTALVLSYKRFSWYYYSAMVLIFLFMIFTTSATSIYISLLVTIAYPLYEIYKVIRKNKLRGFITLGIYLLSLGTFVGFIALFINTEVPMFVNLWRFIDKSLLHKDFLTITGRTKLWRQIIDLLKNDPLDFIFGLGHQTGSKIFQLYNKGYYNVKSAHNGVMEMFLRYGLIGAILYCGMLLLVFFCLALHIKHKRYRFAVIYGMAYLALLAHSISESTHFFTPNVGGVFFGMFFLLPIMNILQNKKFKELKEETIKQPIEAKKIPTSFLLISVLFIAGSIAVLKLINNLTDIDIFSCIVMFFVLLLSTLFVLIMINNHAVNIINDKFTALYIRRLEVVKKYEK